MPEENFEQPIEPISLGSSDSEPTEPTAPDAVNRPAEGARIGTPDDVLDGGFNDSQSAGDFLGLDTELTSAMAESDLEWSGAPKAQAQGEQELDLAAELAPGDLMSSPDAPLEDADQGYAEGEAEYIEGSEEGEDGEFYAEFDEEYDEEYEDEYELPSQQGMGKLKMLGAFALGLIVVLGVTAGPSLLSRFQPKAPVELAQGPATQPQQPASQATPVAQPSATPVAATGSEPVIENNAAVIEAEPTQLAQQDAIASEPAAQDSSLGTNMSNDVSGSESLDPEVLGFGSDALADLSDNVNADGVQTAGLESTLPDFTKDYTWAERGTLDMIWRGESIPMEAIHAPAQMMTPYVGLVRATLANGSSLDGRLHALGEGSVWLRDLSNGGLLGLDGSMVNSIERLAAEAGASLSHGTGGVTALSKKVRVTLPGGTIAGTLISREGDWVSIQTPSGGVIQLKNPEMEEITQERVILVRN